MLHKIIPQLVPVLTRWETFQNKAYRDNDGTWHAYYGHGNINNLPPFIDENFVGQGEAEGMKVLLNDLNQVYSPQLETMLETDGIEANDFEFNGLLDVLYNRGAGRLRKSLCWHWLQQTQEKWFMAEACKAIVFSNVEGYMPLDVAKDKVTGIPRVHLGLTLRRIDDASLFQTKTY